MIIFWIPLCNNWGASPIVLGVLNQDSNRFVKKADVKSSKRLPKQPPSPEQLQEQARIASRLRQLIEDHGYDAKGAADYCGIPRSSFYPYLTGARPIPMAKVRIICHTFDITVEELIDPRITVSTYKKHRTPVEQWMRDFRSDYRTSLNDEKRIAVLELAGLNIWGAEWPNVKQWITNDERSSRELLIDPKKSRY